VNKTRKTTSSKDTKDVGVQTSNLTVVQRLKAAGFEIDSFVCRDGDDDGDDYTSLYGATATCCLDEAYQEADDCGSDTIFALVPIARRTKQWSET